MKANEVPPDLARFFRPASGQRDVWPIATQSFPGSHFATFPEAIPERCIKAGTSERGCCPECGEPWERVVERTTATPGQRHGYTALCSMRNDGKRPGSFTDQTAKTIGWRAGCECKTEVVEYDDGEMRRTAFITPKPVPCTVLDPFMGSGTTIAVALKLGRHGVGCELNPKYVELARERIGLAAGPSTYQSNKVVDAPLFACGGNQ